MKAVIQRVSSASVTIDEGVKINPLPIDESGEFTEKWPGGFFEERIEDIL